ncbi:hypothetical protein [Methylobacterium sp. PvR107]|uniref:hypothetical protein n=1 Tax=Methylobacterium sp. PvR107 TaxID=2806597 RepID=UPI001AE808EB|nr:hypothetical protein [Methylobacterium sp. PvR107]MBP1179961.1 hypothetical protein [Methylobacterium sp. PvR107]
MALKLADRVKETTTTEGTGDITLAGAVNGFLAFSSRLSTGDITFYAIVLGTQWEVGIGTLTAATTLKRTTVLSSSNGDALVPFAAGTKEVFIDLPGTLADRIADFAISEASVASAATVDLGAQNSRKIAITGTTAITSFGTRAHAEKLLRFTGACTLTYDATALILPGGQSIVTAAGDTALATSDANGNWRIRHYQRADGSGILNPGTSCGTVTLSGGNLLFKPFRGNVVMVGGVLRTIPTAGVPLAPTGLTVGTRVYGYLYWNGTALAAETSTTGYVVDPATGMALKNGDASRTLYLQTVPIAGPAFSLAQTRSWFNDPGQMVQLVAPNSFVGTGGSAYDGGTIPASLVASLLLWAGDTIEAAFTASGVGSSPTTVNFATAFVLDGSPVGDRGVGSNGGNDSTYSPVSIGAAWTGLSEALHTIGVIGRNPSGNGAYFTYASITDTAKPTLRVNVRRALT